MALLAHLRLEGKTLLERLRQPDETGERFLARFPELHPFWPARDIWGRALVAAKYEGYIERQQRTIARFRELEDRPLPPETDYDAIPQLRHEARERWKAVRPRSVGQAARVSGIQPTDVSMLVVYLSARDRSSRPPVISS